MRFMKKRRLRENIKHQHEIERKLEDAMITARTILLPCEDEKKVKQTLLNIVQGDVRQEEYNGEKYLVIYTSGRKKIERIFRHFRNRRVLATLRKFLVTYSSENEIVFYLHKQAAFKGTLSLVEPGESPGGEVVVSIKVENAKNVIIWLTKF